MPLIKEKGSEVVEGAEGNKVKVEIEQLTEIGIAMLEVDENVDSGRVTEAIGARDGLENEQ